MDYGDFMKTCDKAFSTAEKSKIWWISKGSCFNSLYIFDKKTPDDGIKNENMSDQQLEEELHKPIIRKFINWKKYNLL